MYFNLTDEINDTIGTFVLKTIFGDKNVELEEKVRIYADGREQTMTFCAAFRTVFGQTMSKTASILRVFLFDGMSEWCLTPGERTVRHNQNVIKQFLREKRAKHAEWRKKCQISEKRPLLHIADMLLADKKHFPDEESVVEELVNAMFGLGQTTISAVIQLFYQLMRDSDRKQKVIKELEKRYCYMNQAEREQQDTVDQKLGHELSATLLAKKMDLDKDELLYLERCLMEALRLDPPIPVSTMHKVTEDCRMHNGELLPRGTRFMFNFFAIHRDASQYQQPDKFIPERFSRSSEYYLTPGGTQRHPLSWCPFMTGSRMCNGNQFAFMVAKTVTSMFLAAMPEIDFRDTDKFHYQADMPSSIPVSKVKVECYAPVPFRI